MVNYYKWAAIAAAIAVGVGVAFKVRTKTFDKDATAQGVAKARHAEFLLANSAERLFVDPYAQYMYPGSSVQAWIGGDRIVQISDWFIPGVNDLLCLRTKWIDDQIVEAAAAAAAADAAASTTTATKRTHITQLVILGAGYDTRGFRLDLPSNFAVLEVDQPGVQSRKRKILEAIAETDATVASRLQTQVNFLGIDFNTDSVRERLLATQSDFDASQKTIVTLEGVTQYIPKDSTAGTLSQIHGILPEGSLLIISYVPQAVFDNPSECGGGSPKRIGWMLKTVAKFGEPWISSWTPESFASFLGGIGFEVVEDVGIADLNEKYLVPRNRGRTPDQLSSFERYVIASVTK